VTNRVPASRAALLSSLAAMALGRSLDAPDAFIGVWTVADNGEVSCTQPLVAEVERTSLSEWELVVDADVRASLRCMRNQHLPSETGGSLVGIIDTLGHKIHVVEALAAPPDSVGSTSQFERGVAGLSGLVNAKMARVMEQIRYLGEWHSHPPRHSVDPSPTDLAQLGVTSLDAAIEGFPGLSIIVGDTGLNALLGSVR
jgi:hypothetical protein